MRSLLFPPAAQPHNTTHLDIDINRFSNEEALGLRHPNPPLQLLFPCTAPPAPFLGPAAHRHHDATLVDCAVVALNADPVPWWRWGGDFQQ